MFLSKNCFLEQNVWLYFNSKYVNFGSYGKPLSDWYATIINGEHKRKSGGGLKFSYFGLNFKR